MPEFASEDFRTVPNDFARVGNFPHDAETFRSMQNSSERRSDHTLTVHEVARMFEAAGVARTERSITNWCQSNKTGIARLDAFFDSNSRKYFITPESVEIAIHEEQSKERAKGITVPSLGETGSDAIPNGSATVHPSSSDEAERLRHEVVDLQITNRVKDKIIERFEHDRDKYEEERSGYVEKLMTFNRLIGQLETRLGIEPPMGTQQISENGSAFQKASEETNSAGRFSES